MGCKQGSARISNGLINEGYVQVVVSVDFLQLKKQTIKWGLQGEFKGDKTLQTKSLAAKISGNYSSQSSYEVTKAVSVYQVGPQQTCVPTFKGKDRYLSIFVNIEGKKLPVFQNRIINNLNEDARWIVYLSTSNHLIAGKIIVDKNCKMVRQASGNNEQRNYPPGWTCPKCQRTRVCKSTCDMKNDGFFEGDGKYYCQIE